MSLHHQIMLDSPAGYWPMDETSGTTAFDRSGNGLNGTYSGAVPAGASGPFDRSASFDGADDWVEVPHNSLIAVTDNFTLEIWAYLNSLSICGFIAKTSNNLPRAFDWRMDDPVSNTKVILLCGNGTVNPSSLSATPRVTGRWYHLAVSRAGTNHSHFVDGVLDGSNTVTSVAASDAGLPLRIGNRHDAATDMNGRLAHAAIYPSVLSAARIKAHYEAGIRSGVVV